MWQWTMCVLVYLASLDSGAQGGLCLPLSIFEGPPVLSETLQQKKKNVNYLGKNVSMFEEQYRNRKGS